MNKTLLKKLRIVSALVAVAVMAVIFVLSSQNGEASDDASIKFTSFLLSADFDFALLINFLIRKFAHIIEYAALAVPVYLFAESFRITEGLSCIYSAGFTVLYAVSDEIHQYFVEGRSCSFDDVMIDSLGGIFAIVVIHIIFFGLRRKNQKIIPHADEIFLKLFSEYISGNYEKSEPFDSDMISEIIEKSYYHKLIPIISSALIKSGAVLPDSGISGILKYDSAKQVYIQTVKTRKFLEIYNLMLEEGLKPVCVKGIICRALYPDPDFRASSDEDIVVSNDEWAACAEILEKSGFIGAEGKADEMIFIHKSGGLKIEVHKNLFSDDGVYSKFNSLLGDMTKDCDTIVYENCKLICPSADKHMLYLILHAFKHFVHSGVGVRQVCDIAMFARKNKINWAEIFDKCSKIGASVFLNGILILGSRYFGLELSEIKESVPAFNEKMNVDNLMHDLIGGGIYGSNSLDRVHSATMTLNKYRTSMNDEKVSALFPPLKKMQRKYPFLLKYPILLPIAWVMRLASYTASEHSSSATLEIGKKRIELMKELKII